MASLDEIADIKRRLERAQQEQQRAAGALEVTTRQMASEFDCPSLENAEEKAKTMTKEVDRLREQYEKELAQFKAKHKEFLE